LDDAVAARRYLLAGLGAVAVGSLVIVLWWPGQVVSTPGLRFHRTWPALLMHLLATLFTTIAMIVLRRKPGWLRNVLWVAFSFLLISELRLLLNFYTNWQYNDVLCPIGNSFHMLAVPLFGYVYFREQAIEKKQAEDALRAYRYHLEELVEERTAKLTDTNDQLQSEIREREQAQAETTRRNTALATQNAIAATISQSLDLPTILTTTLERTLSVLGMQSGRIYLLAPDDEHLVLEMEQGTTESRWMTDERAEHLCYVVSERAATALKPVVINEEAPLVSIPDLPPSQDGQWLLVSTPLVSQGQAVGALTMGAQHSATVGPQELELLMAIGHQVGMAVENARLYREAEGWAGAMALLHEVSVFLSSSLDAVEISDQITQQSAKLMACSVAYLFQWDKEHREAVKVSTGGASSRQSGDLRLQIDQSPILPQILSQHEPICVQDALEDPRIPARWRESLDLRAALFLPVWVTGQPLGFLLLVESQESRRWRSHDVDLLFGFMDRAAVALEKAYLHKQLEWAAALEERQRIAAEMHDGLAQTLSFLGLKTDQAAELLETRQIQQVPDELHQMQDAISRATHEVRRSIASLQESPRPRQSLQEALNHTVHEVAPASETPAQVRTHLEAPLYLPPSDLEQVQRVVQEALLNAHRHAQAREITVLLERRKDLIEVVVVDDGRGFDPESPPQIGDHFGLSIMRARAARIGGELKLASGPGRGTRLALTWPMHPEPDGERQIGLPSPGSGA
jgi:signal transduction histidine kinase